MGILRLMTIDCSLVATNYLRLLYPKIFRQAFGSTKIGLFDLRYAQGINCKIAIDKAGKYVVTQKKVADIILATDISAPPLATTLEIDWSVAPIDTGWKSCLRIPSWKILNLSYWNTLMEILTQPADPSYSELCPPGWEFVPDLKNLKAEDHWPLINSTSENTY